MIFLGDMTYSAVHFLPLIGSIIRSHLSLDLLICHLTGYVTAYSTVTSTQSDQATVYITAYSTVSITITGTNFYTLSTTIVDTSLIPGTTTVSTTINQVSTLTQTSFVPATTTFTTVSVQRSTCTAAVIVNGGFETSLVSWSTAVPAGPTYGIATTAPRASTGPPPLPQADEYSM